MGGKGHHRSSSESEDWGDESWIVDCPCGVNYDDGEEMVECDECGVWVHTSCCRVPKDLPTYMCDKCKNRKKLKESEEELGVAQLLAESLPTKPVSFDERSHDKETLFINAHFSSTEMSMEERAHVHGIPGGDPALFVGVSKVFCRQLWKYTGYVPKHLNVETNELPEPHEDVLEFMRDFLMQPALPVHGRTNHLLQLENGHAKDAPANDAEMRDGLSTEKADLDGETSQGKYGKPVDQKKGEGKQDNHAQTMKEQNNKYHHHVKRSRDDDVLKEQPSKKKPRSNGEMRRLEDRMWRHASHADNNLLGGSPPSSPKNPKAMKKLAGQEFKEIMGEGITLCSGCGKLEAVNNVSTGDCSRGSPNSLCQDCGSADFKSPAVKKVEMEPIKQEMGASPLIADTKAGSNPVLRYYVSRREMDHRDGAKAARARESSKPPPDTDCPVPVTTAASAIPLNGSADVVKSSVAISTVTKGGGNHDNMSIKEERKRATLRPDNVTKLRQEQSGAAQKVEEYSHALLERLDPCKHCEESTARLEDLQHAGNALETSLENFKSTRTPSDTQVVASNRTAAPERRSPGISGENPDSKPRKMSTGTSTVLVSSSASAITPEIADENRTIPTSLKPSVHTPKVENASDEKARKMMIKTDGKGQGSARTAGHLPASVRNKVHVERCIQQVIAAAPNQNHTSAGQSHEALDMSLMGPQRSSHTLLVTVPNSSTRGSANDEASLDKHNGQFHVDVDSPGHSTHHVRATLGRTTAPQKAPTRCSETSSPSHLPSLQRPETDLQSRPKVPQGQSQPRRLDGVAAAVSPRLQVVSDSDFDAQVSASVPANDGTVMCEQHLKVDSAGLVHAMCAKSAKFGTGPSAVSSNCEPSNLLGTGSVTEAQNCVFNLAKVSVSSLKSPSSGTSSSSPTSPLVTTPSSKPQWSGKITESRPSQRSISGCSTPNVSAPHSSSKSMGVATCTNSGSRQVGTLQPSKSVPSPGSPSASKVVGMSKQSSRSASLPVMNVGDGRIPSGNPAVIVANSRTGNLGSATGSVRDSVKSVAHSSSKTSAAGKTTAPSVVARPPSAKVSHALVVPKASSASRQHSGHGSNASKPSALTSTKHVGASQGKVGVSHKDEKGGLSSAAPVSKASMPPLPHAPMKRSSSTTLTASGAATTLKDEELALLLHQELNSSPRVPRVPRVRPTGGVAPSISSAKGSNSSAVSGTTHKDQVSSRKRSREDHRKDPSKTISLPEEAGRAGKRADESKMEHGKSSVDKVDNPGTTEVVVSKDKSAGSESMDTVEGGSRRQGFARGNLSIVVPGSDDVADVDKGRVLDSSVVTLPGLIDEVLLTRGHLPISYEDVCDAVEPYWPKLRKQNGERYAYASHRQAVLDCLRNRSAWAHLVGRGPKTNPSRKRRRIDAALTDTDDESEVLSTREKDALPPCVNAKRWTELKWDEDEDYGYSGPEATAADDVPKGKRRARRRRNLTIDDGTDGEDGLENASAKGRDRGERSGEFSLEDGSETESSPSSEEAVSNYSDEDEEMVVRRGTRKKRRPADESSGSDYDAD